MENQNKKEIRKINTKFSNHQNLTITTISDIHGYFHHLKDIQSFAKKSDLILCLGDLDQYNEFTQKGEIFLKKLNKNKKLRIISGNCDPTSFQQFLHKNSNISYEKQKKNEFGYTFCGYGGQVSLQEMRRSARVALDGRQINGIDLVMLNREFDNALFLSEENGKLKTIPENNEMVEKWKKYEAKYIFQEDDIYNFFSEHNPHKSDQFPQIWVTHQPPFGFPESKFADNIYNGSKGLFKSIEEQQPFLVISGHLHKHGIWEIGPTTCISVPPIESGQIAQISITQSEIITNFIYI